MVCSSAYLLKGIFWGVKLKMPFKISLITVVKYLSC